ncbi:hypothetical protein [Clostridium sp. OS1-26]|uniref:hypothetical protein n=1 Tax=Clostridium sp. OS1-26 TaxID=3070681 RepID=UPI0027E12AD8|nr:hypothetical protein [Clostridium sp. OS1-26]WML35665.1 hypothetical protein RCG18_02620 [Clostridium sp. OS1-26]
MSLIKLVNEKVINTTNKTVEEVIKEALADIPMTIVEASRFLDMLEEEFRNIGK